MNKSGIFDRVNRSRVTVAAVCLGIFLVMLVCNLWTDLVADDYRTSSATPMRAALRALRISSPPWPRTGT